MLRSPATGALAADILVAVLSGFRARPALALRGMLYDRDQGQSVSSNLNAVPNSRAR
jgi:hypothetical protein